MKDELDELILTEEQEGWFNKGRGFEKEQKVELMEQKGLKETLKKMAIKPKELLRELNNLFNVTDRRHYQSLNKLRKILVKITITKVNKNE